jgi:hypothetical protein
MSCFYIFLLKIKKVFKKETKPSQSTTAQIVLEDAFETFETL